MKTHQRVGRVWVSRRAIVTAIVIALAPNIYAQSSPLTVQPSTGRVGVGNTNPAYTLDVTGTVNATALRGDGSQLTNLPVTGGSTAIDKVTADATVVNTGAETTLNSFTVAGGTFGTDNVLRLTIQITDLDVGAEESCVLRFKYGGTTLGSFTVYNWDEFNNSQKCVKDCIFPPASEDEQMSLICKFGNCEPAAADRPCATLRRTFAGSDGRTRITSAG